MRFSIVALAIGLLLASLLKAEESATLEARMLAAIADDRPKLLAALVEEMDRLKPEARSALLFRVHDDALELRFRGDFVAEEFMREGLEYVVARKWKSYETLVVVGDADIERLTALGKLLATDKKSRPQLRYQVAWIEEESVHVEDLRSIVRPADCDDRAWFFSQLEVLPDGLGGSLNIQTDSARLPKKAAKMTLLISIPLSPTFQKALK
jgi:hypothetical protein